MLCPANEPHLTLTLPGIEHDFKVLAFTAIEAISQCYRIELQLVSEQRPSSAKLMNEISRLIQLAGDYGFKLEY